MDRLMRVPVIAVISLAIVLSAPSSLSARMGPSILMIHGGALKTPVLVRIQFVADLGTYADFWAGRSQPVVPAQFVERPYFNVAMFWGAQLRDADPADLKPENAHQHGRLYVATKVTPAAMVSSAYAQMGPGGLPLQRPVPTDVREFKYGAWLTEGDLRLADKIGVPLRER
jgi:hypothetical protein